MNAPTNITRAATASIRTDGGTQPRAAIYQNVVDDYATAVADGATFPPVVVFFDGADYWLADGFHRLAAYRQAEAEQIPADIRQGTRRDAILHSVSANESHGLRRTNEDKRRAILTMLTNELVMLSDDGLPWSDNALAKRCHVSNHLVAAVKESVTWRTPSDTRAYIDKHGNESTMDTSNIGKTPTLPFDPQQSKEIVEQAKAIAQQDEDARRDLLHGEGGLFEGVDKSIRGTLGTGENEWYTPEKYIDAARAVLGAIDLDPASSKQAQKTVKATRFFTEEMDGLAHEWKGRIWLNPPYAQPHIENFADKMIAEVKSGNVTSAIMLTHNYTDTAWFQKLAQYSSAICFTQGRIRFISPDGELAAPTQGQAFFYFGSNPGAFFEVFRPIGIIARVVK